MRGAWRGWAGWVSSAAMLALAACGGESSPDPDASPEVMVTEGVDFGRRPVGETSEATAELYNGGASPFTITGLFVEGRDPAAFQVGFVPATVRPGQTLALPLSFRPGEGRAYAAHVVVATTGTPDRITIPVSGLGAPWLDRTELDFGEVVETTAAVEEVHLENLLDRPLTLDEVRIASEGQGSPFVAAADRSVLAPGERATLTVRFEPSADGTRQADLVVATDGPGGPLRLPLVGRGTDWASAEVVEPGPQAVVLRNRLERAVPVTLEVLAPFSVFPSELLLPPGEDVPVVLDVASEPPGDVSRTLVVRAPDLPAVAVALHRPSVQNAFLAPNDFDFGTAVDACGPTVQAFCVYNTGGHALTLASAALRGDDAFRLGEVPEGVEIPAGDRACLDVAFAPSAPGSYSATLEVRVAEAAEPLTATLVGSSGAELQHVDHFHTLKRPKVDILLVLDRGASMADHREVLARELRALADVCLPADPGIVSPDAHVGIVSADPAEDGALRPWGRAGAGIVAPGTASPGEALLAAAGLDFEGVPDNQPMHMALRALSPDRAAGTNAGFRREDAWLAVVLVTDRADTSPMPVARYAEALAEPRDHYVLPVTGGSPPCDSACGAALESSGRLSALAEAGHGGSLPVCDCDWGLASHFCRFARSGGTGLSLRWPPDPASLQVWVTPPEGPAYHHTDWTFDPARNSLYFDRGAYPHDSLVEVHYVRACGD